MVVPTVVPSKLFNNPFPLLSVPVGYTDVLVAVVELPASIASEQPSLSESKSNELGIPSLSKSKLHSLSLK